MTDELAQLKRKVYSLERDARRRIDEVGRLCNHNQRLMDEKKKQSRKVAALEAQHTELLEAIAKRRGSFFRRLIGLAGTPETQKELDK